MGQRRSLGGTALCVDSVTRTNQRGFRLVGPMTGATTWIKPDERWSESRASDFDGPINYCTIYGVV